MGAAKSETREHSNIGENSAYVPPSVRSVGDGGNGDNVQVPSPDPGDDGVGA